MNRFRYRTRRDGASWMWLTWPENIIHNDEVTGLLREVKDVPGVKVFPGGVNICRTAQCVDVVKKLFQATRTSSMFKTLQTLPTMPWDGLYEHQNTAVTHMLSNGGRGLLADAPGLGKTRTAITFAQHWRRFYDDQRPAVILAKKYLRRTWVRELAACGVESHEICTLESLNIDNEQFDPEAQWYFVNPEIVRVWWPRILQARPAVTLVDEAHHYKDLRTNRSKGAQMVSTAPHVLFMTGTPMPDRPQDLWSLLNMITGAGSWGTAVDFIQRYAGALYNGFGYVPQMPTNVEELQERMAPWYLRRTIDDLRDSGFVLPELSRNIVEASWEDARLGVQVKRKHDEALKQHLPAIAEALREGRISEKMLQILSELRVQTSMAKIPATVELVQELRAAGESCVVFTWTVEAAQRITDALWKTRPDTELESVTPFTITGNVAQSMRDSMVERFQRDGGVIVATYATLAEGVTLTKARFVILHDLDWTPSTIEQAEKRIHRISQTQGCVSTWMVLRDSADEIFARVLEWKLLLNAELISNSNSGLLTTAAQVARRRSFENEFEAVMRQWIDGTIGGVA